MRIEAPIPAELEILRQRGIAKSILERACNCAARVGMSPSEYLVSRGFLTEDTVYSALAEACGLPFLPTRGFRPQSINCRYISLGADECGPLLIGLTEQDTIYAVAPDFAAFADVLDLCRRRPELRRWVRITTPDALRHATTHLNSPEGDLESRYPDFSARYRVNKAQIIKGVSLGVGFLFGCFIPLVSTLVFCALAMALCCTMFGVARLASAWSSRHDSPSFRLPPSIADGPINWPRYTILIPLYREAASVSGLVQHLKLLQYPRDRLQVLFLLERDDLETARHLKECLPANMEIVWVPDGAPRTKPRALSHGLEQATGSLITVYDAEDRPEPDQLKLAAFFFALATPEVACLQARLSIDNSEDSFLTRHFALEYACLFDQLLPWLHRHDWPFPLGGTSNHFRTEALIATGAWDKFNVTEDADLGIRLARLGYACGVLPSSTFEEAPITWKAWRQQRARWHKGWIQTFFVHTRNLGHLLQDLGWRRLCVALSLIGGNIAVMALSPVCVVLVGLYSFGWLEVPQLEGSLRGAFTAVCLGSVCICYSGSVAALLWGARQRRLKGVWLQALTLPAYWALNACAFYQAAWEFLRQPHGWNKTEHGVSKSRRKILTAKAASDILEAGAVGKLKGNGKLERVKGIEPSS